VAQFFVIKYNSIDHFQFDHHLENFKMWLPVILFTILITCFIYWKSNGNLKKADEILRVTLVEQIVNTWKIFWEAPEGMHKYN
jgi:hypothetical protein